MGLWVWVADLERYLRPSDRAFYSGSGHASALPYTAASMPRATKSKTTSGKAASLANLGFEAKHAALAGFVFANAFMPSNQSREAEAHPPFKVSYVGVLRA